MPDSGPQNTTTTTTHELSPQQQQLLDPVIPIAEDFLNTPLQLFPGSTIAPITPQQEQGRGMITDAAQSLTGVAQGAIGQNQQAGNTGGATAAQGMQQGLAAGQQGLGGLGSILNENAGAQGSRSFLQSGALLHPASNPVLAAQSQAAIAPIAEQLQEEILPGIDSSFVGNNMFGSSRQGIAQGRAIDSFIDQAGDITTNLQANNFNQGLGAMLQSSLAPLQAATSATGQALEAGTAASGQGADMLMQSLGLTPELGQFSFIPGVTMEALGSTIQGENSALLREQATKFMQQQMLPMMQAQQVANLAMGLGGGTTIADSVVPGTDPMQQIFGLAMMLPFL